MDISTNLEGLRSLLGVSTAETPPTHPARTSATASTSEGGSDRATVSSAASEVSQAAAGDGVRTEKVESIRAALAAGTYKVPDSAVASKLVDAMLGGGSGLDAPTSNVA